MKASITKNKSFKRAFTMISSILFWIFIWEIASIIINKEAYLPSPFTTFHALCNLLPQKVFYFSIMSTLFRVFTGFIISCVLAILLGLLCGFNKYIHDLFMPLIVTIRATPVISIIIIAIIWFKSNNVPIFISFLMCFPIIWTNVVEGIKNVDIKLIEMTKIYKIKKYRVITSLYIPSIIPYLTSGMSTALGIGWKVTVAAEVLSLPKFAIGTHLYDSKVYIEIPYLFAWTIVVVMLSFLFENFFRKMMKRFTTWR